MAFGEFAGGAARCRFQWLLRQDLLHDMTVMIYLITRVDRGGAGGMPLLRFPTHVVAGADAASLGRTTSARPSGVFFRSVGPQEVCIVIVDSRRSILGA